MRIRFNINPTGEVELAIIALINGYPDGLRSELVRRLIVTGYNYHSGDEDILQGINIHHTDAVGGTTCKFNISPHVPLHDPALKAFNKAKSLNSLIKPLYLNKLVKAGYLFETGQLHSSIIKTDDKVMVKEQINAIDRQVVFEQPSSQSESLVQSDIKTSANRSLKNNDALKNSLKNLSN